MMYRIHGPEGFMLNLFIQPEELDALKTELVCEVDERFQVVRIY